MSEKEIRVWHLQELEARAATDDEPPVIRGYAAVFDQLSDDLGGFREKIRPGAFARSLEESDVRALWNHDANYVLGRNRARTLHLDEDAHGLRVTIMPPDAQWARDLIASMERGDVDQMSFGFYTREEAWPEPRTRELIDVELFDVSIVTYPAYPQTSAAVRMRVEQLTAGAAETEEAEEAQPDPQVRAAARARQLAIQERMQ